MTEPVQAPTGDIGQVASDALDVLHFADCTVDVASRTLLRGGQPVPMRRQVFDLLLLLLQRRPRTVSLDELRHAVWSRERVAASAIARTVLEARRAIGDECPESRLIVNVYGVGYRFDGQLHIGAAKDAAVDLPRQRIEALLHEAEQVYYLQADVSRARHHAEMALAEAMNSGLKVPCGHALAWLGWFSMWTGSIEEASGHAQHALEIARAEHHLELQAEVQTVEALIQLCLGDFERAMCLLQQAYAVLQRAGRPGYRYRCENLSSVVAKHLGHFEAARLWCADARRTAMEAGLRLAVLRARANDVDIGIGLGQAQWREGQHDLARQTWNQALLDCEELLPQLDPRLDPLLQACCYGHLAELLGHLRRHAAARAALCKLDCLLASYGHPHAPAVLERQTMARVLGIRLSMQEGDVARAMHEVQQALADIEARAVTGPWKPQLLSLASQVAESCGRLDLALQWSRAHHAAHVALEGARSQSMIEALRMQLQQTSMAEQLEAARRNIRFLEHMNAQLLQRQQPALPDQPVSAVNLL